jgi:hypothetical protein
VRFELILYYLQWFESILSTAMRKRCADEKQLVQLNFGLPDCQPLVLFALCTGASSDPMVRTLAATILHY